MKNPILTKGVFGEYLYIDNRSIPPLTSQYKDNKYIKSMELGGTLLEVVKKIKEATGIELNNEFVFDNIDYIDELIIGSKGVERFSINNKYFKKE